MDNVTNDDLSSQVAALQEELAQAPIEEAIRVLAARFPGKVTFSTSFSNEDQVVTDFIRKSSDAVKIFTLDTGRLFNETYNTWASTNAHYGIEVKAYHPDAAHLETMLNEKGPNPFYASVENRKECCFIRKVEPLRRALSGNSVWITGLRAEHSQSRADLPIIEWDESNHIIKYNPLLHWTTDEVTQYVRKNHLPYNVLHDKGYVSIGCAPCTRAIRPGEDFRAGRWWWEDASKKECGLHIHQPSQTTPIHTTA